MKFPFEFMSIEQLIRYGVVHPSLYDSLKDVDNPYLVAQVSGNILEGYDVTALAIDYYVELGYSYNEVMKLGGGRLDIKRIRAAYSERDFRGSLEETLSS